MKFYYLLVLLCTNLAFAKECPETLLKNFSVLVKSQKQAEGIFREYFSPAKGFPKFDPSKVRMDNSPSCSSSKERNQTCYFYYDWYGFGPSGVGGYLYPNGRLVKRGYCK